MSTNKKKSILTDIDTSLAPLNYAVELQKAAASVGFDWPHITSVVEKIHEELDEVLAETGIADNQSRLHDEIGDLLFAITNLARHLDIDPNLAIFDANEKFFRRFKQLCEL
jgi:ATP diphosphatase